MMTAQAVTVTGQTTFTSDAAKAATKALLEATRILSETEPAGGFIGIPLSVHATRYPQGEAMLVSGFDSGFGGALAESLAAIMPELDHLAAETLRDTARCEPIDSVVDDAVYMTTRNRATLAAMGGR